MTHLTSIRIRGVEIPRQNNKENDRQRERGQAETPHNEAMALANANHRVECGTNQEPHKKSAEMGYMTERRERTNRLW